ncbi:MAG TPA: FAD-dependent monooxygenase [Symbiobacteriaceae bacterium]|nr:FAD-dependent monooxygenase [Symbiobacteriaceae bacterium]
MTLHRIGIAGAGPAGLYAALLLKKANPACQVDLVERNPAGATYGFGVVLSDRTLTHFRAADAPSYDALTAHQATWDAIETIYGGERVRCEGHYYLGIARKKLLDLLQQRCLQVGVGLQFDTDLRDLGRFRGADLIIAADGVNSTVRAAHADAFGPTLTPGRSKYIWLGLEWTPSAFTFLFVETEHGLFQAHIYPYDREASTCVLMCGDATWRRAGLDRMSEAESLAFCRELLAPYTGGARVMGNRSLWYTFQTVRNRCWSHGNLVLLGDAAHTAHWSIGSGTKLAMEDAIALVRSLGACADVGEALCRYEAERRPVVERLQAAGQVSESYCEAVAPGLAPVQFAFQLMTRSGRLDYGGLRARDPGFVEAVDQLFGGCEPARAPLRLGDLWLSNRLVDGEGAGLVFVNAPDPAAVAAVHAGGACVGLRLWEASPSLVRAAVEAGVDLLELAGRAVAGLADVRALWPAGRPLAVRLEPGASALGEAPCDLVALDSDDPALGARLRAATGLPVMMHAATGAAAHTLVAGARADLCRVPTVPAPAASD